MAEKNDKTEQSTESVALRLFAERSARMHGRNMEQLAAQSFRDAETFLRIAGDHREGKLNAVASTSVLSECSCPNLDRRHPHNLVARDYATADLNGTEPACLSRIKRINDALTANPTLEAYRDREVEWDKPTTNLARTLFPHYVTN